MIAIALTSLFAEVLQGCLVRHRSIIKPELKALTLPQVLKLGRRAICRDCYIWR